MFAGWTALFIPATLYAASDYHTLRQHLVNAIKQDVRNTSFYINKTALDAKVMQAIADVPRHQFVPQSQRQFAYLNRPLPIGHGQTISQPYIVALMTDLLKIKASDKALEIGTGSGYQAAILAKLADKVYSIEIIEELYHRATKALHQLGYDNVTTRTADGYYGWQQAAPFDVIVVTAAASHVPPPLIKQLKPGGRMVIPIGSPFMVQQLVLLEKDSKGNIRSQQILPVRFVALTGKHD